ncbi:2-oxoglutarate dehydrogenase E2 component [Moraxella macacae 0408225]|uniref:Dihydrolipoyllysine-residue succinyltransferase component of 2-oxoglutarate dehydrogenase complex n=1 Tax=Moraxella macacae 0408225 TaxID=1230338 RepID=L2F8B9_9GAMM|nr:2-oxoglutarate dehydrogenase complex dihydrolipoyllysine-residue succinyltransferase [Moraxella macacae]ELA09287.1 2-oxoglutarate dehydrogenase E2 component [Moraxella macacae 0408225]
MAEIKAPVFPESVADGTIVEWHFAEGDAVTRDAILAEIETDKVVLEVIAPADGVLSKIVKNVDDTVLSAEVIAEFSEGATAEAKPQTEESQTEELSKAEADKGTTVNPASVAAPVQAKGSEQAYKDQSPAVRKAANETGVNPAEVQGSGRGGRVTKADMTNPTFKTDSGSTIATAVGERAEKRVPMTRLRARVAERLLAATQETAMLTTFNEVNMKPIMELRSEFKDRFEKRHGVKLGFMSIFVKAATEALKRFPAVNASIDGKDIVYHGYYDVGVAVSSDRGLVVPVLRDTDQMSMADIERSIGDMASKAREGKLAIEDMTGGTFTITNGGVFGSLMSTPIINPPQTAILGMHATKERPMAVNGNVVILPMMYLALSYDHRLIDGKEAVQFLVTIKELVENPAMLLLDL